MTLAAIGLLAAPMSPVAAQSVPIDRLTPQNLAPQQERRSPALEIAATGAFNCPAGSGDAVVALGPVKVVGGLPGFEAPRDELVRSLANHPRSLPEICAVAARLERAYASAGYVLVRVSAPPQSLSPGSPLKLVITDGFIEAVDVDGVPAAIRPAVLRSLRKLIGRRSIHYRQIERAVLLAGNVPGIEIGSTLATGRELGAVRLIITATHRPVTASIGADNRLPASLGTWKTGGTISANGLLGGADRIYLTLSSALTGPDFSLLRRPFRVFGAGLIAPVGSQGLAANVEFTRSDSAAPATTAYPGYAARFMRGAFRLTYPIVFRRARLINIDGELVAVQSMIASPSFVTRLSEDRFSALRLGASAVLNLPDRGQLSADIHLSQGLGGRTSADAEISNVPLSRQGASPSFQKVQANAQLDRTIRGPLRLAVYAGGQTSFGKPLFSSEQFSLEGPYAVSGPGPGELAVDEGFALRAELAWNLRVKRGAMSGVVTPYIVTAAGLGHVARPSAVEAQSLRVGGLGGGLRWRQQLWNGGPQLSASLEYARAYVNRPEGGTRRMDRIGASAALFF